jgi:hypothetical protein
MLDTTEQINNINETINYIIDLVGQNNLEQHHIDMITGLEETIATLQSIHAE